MQQGRLIAATEPIITAAALRAAGGAEAVGFAALPCRTTWSRSVPSWSSRRARAAAGPLQASPLPGPNGCVFRLGAGVASRPCSRRAFAAGGGPALGGNSIPRPAASAWGNGPSVPKLPRSNGSRSRTSSAGRWLVEPPRTPSRSAGGEALSLCSITGLRRRPLHQVSGEDLELQTPGTAGGGHRNE